MKERRIKVSWDIEKVLFERICSNCYYRKKGICYFAPGDSITKIPCRAFFGT